MRVDHQGSALPAELQASGPSAEVGPWTRVDVFDDIAKVAPLWSALQDTVPTSPYQTVDWLRRWFETEGEAAGICPMIVVAYDDQNRVAALLPFGIRRIGLIRAAVFMGGKQSNYNMGLFAPGPVWSAVAIRRLLRRATLALPRRLDVYALFNQPHRWASADNPLALLPHQPSPSACHRGVLCADADAFFRHHQSAAARKKLRSKLKHLGEIGPVRHMVAAEPDEVAAVLDAHIAQKASRLSILGAAEEIRSPVLREFLEAASLPAGPAPLELHGLLCGDRMVATFGGLSHAGRFSGLLISYDATPEIARCSPGELLLTAVIGAKCREGFAGFDLGIGEARYKESYCPITDPLFDSFVPLTLTGRAFVLLESVRLLLKRTIKRSDPALRVVQRLRRLRWRLGRGQAALRASDTGSSSERSNRTTSRTPAA